MNQTKRSKGQYFTTSNPFFHPAFKEWMLEVPEGSKWLEPFAGSNNIVKLLEDAKVRKAESSKWACFDIQPAENTTAVKIEERDTLTHFPEGFDVVITNPPYLGKSSATLRGLPFPDTKRNDVYKHALDKILESTKWACVIVPESFITWKCDAVKKRLKSVVSLNCKMFEDTEIPSCLALFTPNTTDDFYVWRHSSPVPLSYKELEQENKLLEHAVSLRFNDPKGSLGLYAWDKRHAPSIQFVKGEEIEASKVKQTSRFITRISGVDVSEEFLEALNDQLRMWRQRTSDVFLTSNRGLRDDGFFSRRLSYTQASALIKHTLAQRSRHE